MTNALRERAQTQSAFSGGLGEDELREWCWGWNQRCREAGWAHWLHVSRDKETGSVSCKSRTGSDALDVIKTLNGWSPDFRGWAADRLDSEHRILRHVARMGMPQQEWEMRFARRVGGMN